MDKYRTISAVCQGAGLLSGYECYKKEPEEMILKGEEVLHDLIEKVEAGNRSNEFLEKLCLYTDCLHVESCTGNAKWERRVDMQMCRCMD